MNTVNHPTNTPIPTNNHPHSGAPGTVIPTHDTRDADTPPFRVPDVSPRLLWRYVRLYREIVYLTRLPENDRGGCWAGNDYFVHKRKFDCSSATLRRWIAELVACGWVASHVRGPNRLLVPLVDPARLLFFCPQFKRLLTPLLSGSRDGSPVLSERERRSNPARGSRPARTAPAPLSDADRAVVVQAANAGVSPDRAETLVRTLGAQHVADAVAIALGRQKRGKSIEERGGYIVRMAENLASGLWKLPAWLIKERDAAERKAERERAAAQRVVSGVVGGRCSVVGEGAPSRPASPSPNAGTLSRCARSTASPTTDHRPPTTPLTAAERYALEQRALSEVLAAATPLTRPLIERRGIGHNHVQARLRHLLTLEIPPADNGPP